MKRSATITLSFVAASTAQVLAEPVLSMQRGALDHFYHYNHNDSPVMLTDNSGTPVERIKYADYGVATLFDGDGALFQSSPAGNPYLFHGMRFEPETGFLYSAGTGRYYDPEKGRYTSRHGGVGWNNSTSAIGNAYSFSSPWSIPIPTPVSIPDSVSAKSLDYDPVANDFCSDCVDSDGGFPNVPGWDEKLPSSESLIESIENSLAEDVSNPCEFTLHDLLEPLSLLRCLLEHSLGDWLAKVFGSKTSSGAGGRSSIFCDCCSAVDCVAGVNYTYMTAELLEVCMNEMDSACANGDDQCCLTLEVDDPAGTIGGR